MLITSVNAREPPSKVDECGQLVDAVLLCISGVINFDESDVERISLLVNSFKAFQNFGASGTVVLIN